MVGLEIDRELHLSLKRKQPPVLQENEVVVKVLACGICGTDNHIIKGESRFSPPVILGHEFGGVVEELAHDIDGLSVGDIVAIDPNIPCGKCEYCKEGNPHLCINLVAIGVDIDGGMSDRCVVPARQAYKLPNGFNPRALPFIEPLSCVLHGLDRIKVRHGERVLIIGAGTIGLMHLVMLRGIAGELYVEDINPGRRERAKFLGATEASSDLDTYFDAVLECSGTVDGFERSVRLVKRGGRILVFGVTPKSALARISPNAIYAKEITILGSYVNPNTFGRAALLVSKGTISSELFATSVFRIEEFENALKESASGRYSKIVFMPTEEI